MASVAAIREKFLQRDASKESVLPLPNLSSNGVTVSKNESPYKFSIQRPPSCSANSSNFYQKKPPHLYSSSKTVIPKAVSPSLNPTDSNSSATELGRSSSLTDLVALDNEKQHKRLNSVGSLSNSSEFDSPKSEMSCVVSELKSRFEQNESNSSVPKRYMVGKQSPVNMCKQESNQKPALLKLKPNSLILSLNSNNENASAKDSVQKARGLDKGNMTLSSSTSVITCAKAHNDLSSISTSNSNLSEMSINNCVKEEQAVEVNSSFIEVLQSDDDPSLVANNTDGSRSMKLCRRKRLLSLQELGPPPVKPPKPPFLKSSSLTSASITFHEKHSSANFNLLQPPKRPPPKPPNDGTGKPLPPLPISEDIYDDSQNEEHVGTSDLILDDSENQSYSHSQHTTSNTTYDIEDLYHDIENEQQQDKDDIYEIMEIDPCLTDGNLMNYDKGENREEFDEKRQKREKEKTEKKDKEFAKIKEKFNLTGEEFSTVMGTVKKTVKARGNDLSVKEGEMVTIFRMENNPSGKWLVKNEKGKVGYVELSNIQIDPENVKTDLRGRSKRWSDVASYIRTDYVSDRVHGWISRFTPCVRKLNNQ